MLSQTTNYNHTCVLAFFTLRSGSLLRFRKVGRLSFVVSLGKTSFFLCGLGGWYNILWNTLKVQYLIKYIIVKIQK